MLSEIDIEKLPSYRIGEARGVENERTQMILRASSQGVDIQTIASISNLSIHEVKHILHSSSKKH